MKFKRALPALLIALLLFSGAARAAAWMDGYARQVVEEVNMEREKRGLSPLRVDAELTRAAQIRAQEIS